MANLAEFDAAQHFITDEAIAVFVANAERTGNARLIADAREVAE